MRFVTVAGLIVAMASSAHAQSADNDGIRSLESTMAVLAEKAREKETADRRFNDSCQGTLDNVAVALMPRCQGYLSDSSRLGSEVSSEMAAAEEAARRAGVYPGVVRDLKRRYKLDDFAHPSEEPHRFRR